MAFAIVPGRVVDMSAAQTLFVSRIQGGFNHYDLIRSSIKAFSGIRPANMLLAAARAIAIASGITCITGVRTKHQIALSSKTDALREEMFDYDRFWMEIGGQKHDNGRAFSVPITPHHIPLCDRKREHRFRKMLQYQLESDLIREGRDAFERKCLKRRLSGEGRHRQVAETKKAPQEILKR